ncbi:WD40 repeat domain-containing protein [Nannocystis punicea]|uniref:WD40 repeat domain-containing protein n=1 Tax=Nannocystis punicea TaxID=2995304 RepID=A0ABY7GUL7_9BACT|nr:hypothetical protein [Nannocystis poenicansa]WAS90590.1 hypothetical protein O0S08_30755 [Nannocystis poenicansa]
MSWTPHHPAPIVQLAAAPRSPALRIFNGKPYSLAFLADGSLVVGGSHGLTLHDPEAPTPARARVEVGGVVDWMLAHPDGESVVAAILDPRGPSVVRVWPVSARVVTLLRVPSFESQFVGTLSPDGSRVYWRRGGKPPVLFSFDALSGAPLREIELPQDALRAGSLAAREDGTVYLATQHMLVVHPDGRLEPRDDSPFFMGPDPFFATADGGMVCRDGKRISYADGKFGHLPDIPGHARGRTVSHDRKRLTLHDPLDEVTVWDVAAERVIFVGKQEKAIGSIPSWRGNSAASSATHVAAIDFSDASVQIWRMDQPAQPIATMTGYSQGAQRLMFHGGSLTVQTCQPSNTLDGVLEIDLATGATKMLERTRVLDAARTADGQRLLVQYDSVGLSPVKVTQFDPAGEEIETVEVQRGSGEVAVSPDGAMWGVLSHTYPPNRGEPTCFAQWRAFGATKWAKNLKLKGRFQHIALSNTSAAVSVDEQLNVVAFAKGKSLVSTTLPKMAIALAISPDGARVGVSCLDCPRVVRIATGAIVEVALDLPGERSVARSVCVTDEWLFLGHETGAITQHRVDTGEQVAALYGHTDQVLALVWHDGALWSGSEDGSIVKWGDLG